MIVWAVVLGFWVGFIIHRLTQILVELRKLNTWRNP